MKLVYQGSADKSLQHIRWETLDDTGKPVSMGIYFAVLDGRLDNGQEIMLTQKLMFVK